MKTQEYLDLQNKHRKELEEFPIAYAFNDEQLQEALKKLGATKDECVTIFGHGDIVKKQDAKRFVDMLKRHTKEMQERLKADVDFAYAAFLYEMDNHEYAINWDGDDDVLDCFAITWKEIEEWGLQLAWNKARSEHFKHAEEWEMI